MDVTFSIKSAAGTIPLMSTPGKLGEYRLGKGTTGLGMVPDLVRTAPSPAGGGVVRSHRAGVRDGTLVIGITGRDRGDADALMRTLARIIRVDAEPELVAVISGDGTYRLPFIRVGGGQEGYDDSGDAGIEWTLEVQAVDPYWVRDEPVSFVISQDPGDARGLLPDLAELPVMASAALGDIDVRNPGDVPAPMSLRVTGPGSAATIAVAGRAFTVTALGAGEFVQISRVGKTWRVTDQDGANAYSKLGPAPKFPFAPVGNVSGQAILTDAGDGASNAGWFNPLRELVH